MQKFLPKQAEIDKILKIIQRKVLKGTLLPVTMKEIQAGYLVSSYFKDLYLYLAQNKLPILKDCNLKGRNMSRKIYLTRFIIIQDHYKS